MINNNITNIIITASTYMDNEQYDKAIKDISLGISYDPDNYELIFMEALCKEKLGFFIEYRLHLLPCHIHSQKINYSSTTT